jgi:hypothetical protein
MLAHLVYFETLASIEDNTTPAWKSVAAGLVVLRLVDAWLDEGPHIVTTDVTQLSSIRESVATVPAGDPIRSILSGMLDTLQQAETSSLQTVASQMLAYGRALHYAGQWQLANDVFMTLADRAFAIRDSEIAIESSLRLGFVSRKLGNLEAADRAYDSARQEAIRVSDSEGRVRAQLGFALNTVARGNLPNADTLLEQVAEEALQHNASSVVSEALHARAHVAHLRKDFRASVRFGYAALEFAGDALARDRILADVAAAFADLGYLAAARDAHLIVAATTQEEWLRHQTLVNLLDVAIREQHEPAFQDYRRLLNEAPLQPYIRAYFHLYSGQGFRTFGQVANAMAEFQSAIDVATSYNLNQIRHIAETEMERTEVPAVHQVDQDWPNDLREIAFALGEMRVLTTTAQEIGAA